MDNDVGVIICEFVEELRDVLDRARQLYELWDSQCLLGILFFNIYFVGQITSLFFNNISRWRDWESTPVIFCSIRNEILFD